ARLERFEHSIHGGIIRDVTRKHDIRADLRRERLDTLLECIPLIGERQFGTLGCAGLRDAPGDRAAVGEPHDEAPLARHQTCGRPCRIVTCSCHLYFAPENAASTWA